MLLSFIITNKIIESEGHALKIIFLIKKDMILIWLYISNASALKVARMKSEWSLHESYPTDRETIQFERKVSKN